MQYYFCESWYRFYVIIISSMVGHGNILCIVTAVPVLFFPLFSAVPVQKKVTVPNPDKKYDRRTSDKTYKDGKALKNQVFS